ncbi:CRTAC1 family protein [uncultured Jannaschia sp.]|uniref:CRTAC1 family protein n=1 Tax=uncultured Jannaschia sp. TaxID=293347 RepID=UPI00261D1030|nr:CRTAC1 family protein [uncultured Jannaschia sp.]
MSFIAAITILLAGPARAAEPRFLDRAAALPVAHEYLGGWAHFVGGGVALFDCNGDGRADLFAAGGEAPATLLVNVSEPGGAIRFEPGNVAAYPGATGAYPLDFDNDAIMDLMVLRNGPNVALRGSGDCTFADATAEWGIPAGAEWTTAFAATWEGDAALPTLAIGNYVDADDPEGPFGTCDMNWLLRPEGPRYGTPVPLAPGFCPLSMLVSDWRRDGHPMLRVSNDRQYYVRDGYEQMWSLDPLRELGPDDGWAPLRLWGMGIASRDLTGDGLPEVFLTSMGDQMLMRNDGKRFETMPYGTGTFAQRPFTGGDGRPSTGWHAEFADMDNDARPDLFIAKGNVDQMPGLAMADPNNLLMQQADGTFVERADAAGIATTERARGAGIADLNGDGRLDLVVVNRRAPLEVWENATEGAGNWLAVDLRQDGPNAFAVGAFVEIRTDAGVQTREVTVGGGHASGSLVPLHFGLGTAERAELRVTWPDGSASPWSEVAAGAIHRVDRAAE